MAQLLSSTISGNATIASTTTLTDLKVNGPIENSTYRCVSLGNAYTSYTGGNYRIAIGPGATVTNTYGIAIGNSASTSIYSGLSINYGGSNTAIKTGIGSSYGLYIYAAKSLNISANTSTSSGISIPTNSAGLIVIRPGVASSTPYVLGFHRSAYGSVIESNSYCNCYFNNGVLTITTNVASSLTITVWINKS